MTIHLTARGSGVLDLLDLAKGVAAGFVLGASVVGLTWWLA